MKFFSRLTLGLLSGLYAHSALCDNANTATSRSGLVSKRGSDATTMCGPNSDGAQKCGMNLCCSGSGYCGSTADYCTASCQAEYGSCAVVTPKTCGNDSGTSDVRAVGYYQGANAVARSCMAVAPGQIQVEKYTHLNFAFASVDPNTMSVVAAQAGDEDLYKQFTALKSSGLQTWIAIGGAGFSSVDASTHTTWSDLVSDQSKRAAFISSLSSFMEEYGFDGVDLDWEYPVLASSGGKSTDTANLVQLLTEMRAAYGTKYGISLVLPPDYPYLRNFDAKAMESSVDFFNFMTYDLHTYEEGTGIVRGQAEIGDIDHDSMPLWFDGLDGSKINLGIPLYGRGYTLQDASCNTIGCASSGASTAAQCTNTIGVMSIREIKALIDEQGLESRLLEDVMMKEVSWDNQWIGYDDDESIALKKNWANNMCFGGIMYWSVEFE